MPREATPERAPTISRSSLSQQVAEHLRHRIHSRELLPGLRLDESELAGELGVSRTPVREALRQLAAQGLVEIRSHRGCFVSELTPEDRREILPILARLEGWAAHQAAEKASAADLVRLGRLQARMERLAAARDGERYREVSRAFHLALQELADSRWLENLLGELRRKLELTRDRSPGVPGDMRRSAAEHRAVLRAMEGGRPDEAEAAMRDALLRPLDLSPSRARKKETSSRRRVVAARREA